MDKSARVVGIIGASSLVGVAAVPMLLQQNWQVHAFSRRERAGDASSSWALLGSDAGPKDIAYWILLAPIWEMHHYLAWMRARGARRVVAVSSTSRFTKSRATDIGDAAVAARLEQGEEQLRTWADQHGVEWVILRPTLIYGGGLDRNLSEIARFIRRFHFFPTLGPANGLRQPIHMQDVASAAVAALISPNATNRDYNIAGQEALPYRTMVERIFSVLGMPVRLVRVPRSLFQMAMYAVRLIPRYRHWTVSMAERMNKDMVFDYDQACRDLGFAPRAFQFGPQDLPR